MSDKTGPHVSPTWNEGVPIPEEMSSHPLDAVVGTFWDGGDPWGSAMAEGFALCDFITFHLQAGHEIPAEMEYRPAMGGADEDSPIYEELVRCFEYGDFTAADAIEYLPILNRYLDVCKAAGKDY